MTGLERLYLEEVYPHLRGERMLNHIVETILSTPDKDSNLYLLITGSLVYCENNALNHAATEISEEFFNILDIFNSNPKKTTLSLFPNNYFRVSELVVNLKNRKANRCTKYSHEHQVSSKE
uniref:(California timema) hypothetical protein n=1 Tax=Timema californicum TaxID=61474 RepID=A0A7R9PAA3_TIMCA|nr:unnamed protein product [Timema californicum]